MKRPMPFAPDFDLDNASALRISDQELSALLTTVYVAGGFTDQARASVIFDPTVVRQRGTILAARDRLTRQLAGIVIVVLPDSPARYIAAGTQAELHLLAVSPAFRKRGLGRALVDYAVDTATTKNCDRIVLWTQPAMTVAQQLYEKMGFDRCAEKDFHKNGRDFLVYERRLTTGSH